MSFGRSEGGGFAAGLAAAIVTAIGLTLGGWFISAGLVEAQVVTRQVTVKGLAEREVTANLALWPVTIQAAGDDLALLQEKVDSDVALARQFLVESGFDEGEISLGRLQLEDRVAQSWGPDAPRGGRYLINQPLTVRSDNVDLVAQVSRELGGLVRQGVVLTGWQGPSYSFTQLNAIKPEMIEEATQAAREAAQKFAQDSGSQLGGIRNANQGVFVILGRDDTTMESEQIMKNVRIVTTVTYLLEG